MGQKLQSKNKLSVVATNSNIQPTNVTNKKADKSEDFGKYSQIFKTLK